jgi:hypothetical protein
MFEKIFGFQAKFDNNVNNKKTQFLHISIKKSIIKIYALNQYFPILIIEFISKIERKKVFQWFLILTLEKILFLR